MRQSLPAARHTLWVATAIRCSSRCRRSIRLPMEQIETFCKKWNVREFSLFGSVLTDNFRPDSDIDVMVEFKPKARRSLFEMVSMNDELKTIFGRDVDLMTRQAIEQSRNYIRRKSILTSMEVVYVT